MMSIKPDTKSVLTEEQKDMLFFIYQEEKVARDVYITLGKKYHNENIVELIRNAEQRHIDFARELCDTYGVETSHMDEETVGKFESLVLQTLYDACIEQGEKSLIDALEVGEFIGNTEINDLEHASIGMPSDVVDVYEKLKKGNINHSNAFQAAINRAV
jgi:hypothetical protein